MLNTLIGIIKNMVCIYVLKLNYNKYYVGKTENPNFRIEQHFNNNGSAWTKKYKPIEVIEFNKCCDIYDEDKYTKKYMDKYGIDNVRGGTYTKIILDSETKNLLKNEIVSATDKCFNCNKKGHFTANCPYKKKQAEEVDFIEVWSCQYCGKEFNTLKGATFHENIHCKHKKNNSIYDEAADESEDESEDEYYCRKKKTINKKTHNCYRCGRSGHYADSCYAKKHIKGYYIN